MDKKLTGIDIGIINQNISSSNPDIAKKAREKLTEYVQHPDCFADMTAEEWARKIYMRISRPGLQ